MLTGKITTSYTTIFYNSKETPYQLFSRILSSSLLTEVSCDNPNVLGSFPQVACSSLSFTLSMIHSFRHAQHDSITFLKMTINFVANNVLLEIMPSVFHLSQQMILATKINIATKNHEKLI